MSELLTSLIGAGLVVGLTVPLITLAAKGVLVARWRRNPSPRVHGSNVTFLLLVAPSLGAMVWFVSAALHLLEPGAAPACAVDHAGATACLDALLFVLLLIGLIATVFTRGCFRAAPRDRLTARLPPDDPVARRLDRICASDPRLAGMRKRIGCVAGPAPAAFTRGLLWPKVYVDRAFVERLDDEGLRAALLHEVEHVAGRDPLRYVVGSASLALNPFGFLLRRELVRWRAAREAVCDEWAVRRSADPLALAAAIVEASRSGSRLAAASAGLGDRCGLVHLRIQLLLGYASRPPVHAPSWPLGTGAFAIGGILALPHVLGAWPLDAAHVALESVLMHLGIV